MFVLLSTEDGRVTKAELVKRCVYVSVVYYQCPVSISVFSSRCQCLMPILLSTEDGRVTKAEWVVLCVYVSVVYYRCSVSISVLSSRCQALMSMLLSTEDGRVTQAEWVVRWVCAYGDTGNFARFLWDQLFQGVPFINSTMDPTPPFGQFWRQRLVPVNPELSVCIKKSNESQEKQLKRIFGGLLSNAAHRQDGLMSR